MFVAEPDRDLVLPGSGGQIGHGDGAILVVVASYLSFARTLNGHRQSTGTGALRADGELARLSTNAIDQTGTVGGYVARGNGVHVELVRGALNVFSVIFDVELVNAFFARVVFDADGTIAVIFNDGLVNVAAGHLYFGF